MANDKILFRCSGLGKLMTNPSTKAAKEAGELGATAKTFIEEKWLFDRFGFKEEVVTEEIMKGHICEQDSLGLVFVFVCAVKII